MLEWTASVRTETEPVSVPAMTLSRIRTEFETTERAAVPCLWALSAGSSGSGFIAGSGQPRHECAHRPPPVADRVLLLVGQLRHRSLAVEVVGQEHGVVAEAALAARGRRHRAPALAEEQPLVSVARVHVRERADIAKCAARGRLADQLPEVLLVARAEPGVACRAHPRPAAERLRLDPRVVGDRDA